MAEPFDDVVEVSLFIAVEEAEFAARLAAATHVHLRIDVAALDIKSDRAGLAPEKLRSRGQRIVIVAVRRGAEHDRKRPIAVRHIKRDGDLGAVMDADFHLARFELRLRFRFRHSFPPDTRISIGGGGRLFTSPVPYL